MSKIEETEVLPADSLPDEFESMGLVAKIHHDTESNRDPESRNRHAVVVGDEAVVLTFEE